MTEHPDLSTRQLGAVDHAGVREPIEDHDVVLAGYRRDHADIGLIARGKHARFFGVRELGKIGLQLPGNRKRADQQRRAAGTGAVLMCGLASGLDDLRMIGEPQVIVRGQYDHLTRAVLARIVYLGLGIARLEQRAPVEVVAFGLKLRQALLEERSDLAEFGSLFAQFEQINERRFLRDREWLSFSGSMNNGRHGGLRF